MLFCYLLKKFLMFWVSLCYHMYHSRERERRRECGVIFNFFLLSCFDIIATSKCYAVLIIVRSFVIIIIIIIVTMTLLCIPSPSCNANISSSNSRSISSYYIYFSKTFSLRPSDYVGYIFVFN